MRENNYDDCAKALTAGRRIMELDPSCFKCLICIAKCYVHLGDVVSAEDAVEQAVNIEPDSPAFKKLRNDIEMIRDCTEQAKTAQNKGAHKEVLNLTNRGLAIAPFSIELKLLKAESLVYRGDPAEGFKLSSDALNCDQNNRHAAYVQGLSLYYLSELKTSKQLTLRVLKEEDEEAPTYKKAKKLYKTIEKIQRHIGDGNKHIEEKQFVEARDLFKQALNIDPSNKMLNSKLHYTLADIWIHQKHLERAYDSCSRALKLDPKNKKAQKLRARLLGE
ncbi:dnaJ homolog subfamily C member 7-like isoform X2 [Cloeon dipterum]